jgi:hypothetical protein
MTWVLQVNKMPEVCLCPLCVEHRIFQEIISQLESQDRRWMEEMYNKYSTIAADAEYEECINAGDWPSAVEILEARLANAKEKRKQNDNPRPL